ncbi:DUF5344 family protein [Guptibacillus hwajinpoensis]|uniref:DUF5344 family protein n=1 Tax=Guptibacillus hwajinpoensis TaxID=208199 RepID=UPI001CD3457F|nr:DUF5344 family protein [Pseudalkalibacillus hwajinpoensis]MCA0993822.1 YwqI/YxiC family protein [Pseudalkalibacillus hwajinpoensis]
MSKEIRIKYGEVEQSISRIEKTLLALNTEIPQNLATENRLDVVDRMNQLNHLLTEIGNSYRTVLAANNESVRQTLSDMETTDQQLSSSIKLR